MESAATKQARQMGMDAYTKGLPVSPVLNADFMKTISGRLIGDKKTNAELRAYISGWTYQSIAARICGGYTNDTM